MKRQRQRKLGMMFALVIILHEPKGSNEKLMVHMRRKME